jgi:hypothetical protein
VTSKHTWFNDEPRALDVLRQAVSLFARGVRRPWLTLLVSLSFAAGVGALVAFGKRNHAPVLVLRLVEGSGDSSTMPNPQRRLREYVRDAVFTSAPMLELIRRHGLYPSLVKKNPRAALESFREDIVIDVYQNYFVEPRAPGETPRSARVAVSYRSTDRSTALAVTRDLGALIRKHETAVRNAQAERARSEADRARDTLQDALQHRVREVAAKRSEITAMASPDPARQVELVNLLGSMEALERDVDGATRRAASVELGASIEQGGVGLHFEIADDASLPSGAARVRWAWVAALLSFLVGLPLIAVAVGAFFPRRHA